MIADINAAAGSQAALYRPSQDEPPIASQIASQSAQQSGSAAVQATQRPEAAPPQRPANPPASARLESATSAALINVQEETLAPANDAGDNDSGSLAQSLVNARAEETVQRQVGGFDTVSDVAPEPVADDAEALAGSSTETSPEAARTDTSPNTQFETRFDRTDSGISSRTDGVNASLSDSVSAQAQPERTPPPSQPRAEPQALDANLDGAVTSEDIARAGVNVTV